MNSADLIIAIVVILEALRGARLGLLRSALGIVGFWAGLLIGAALAPRIAGLFQNVDTRPAIGILTILGVAVIGGFVGTVIGIHAAALSRKLQLGALDQILGAAFSAAITLVLVWLAASVLTGLPYKTLNKQLRSSAIVHTLNANLPPAPSLLARLPSILEPYGFPKAFIGPEPKPITPVDPATATELQQASQNAGNSTVRFESIGCEGIVFGSGFVVGKDIIATNAHVIAGIDDPIVATVKGRYDAKPIYFDPEIDLALVKVEGLDLPPLLVSANRFPDNTPAVALGYPGGGDFTAVPASIIHETIALGRDIYGWNIVKRDVYSLATHVERGNSGGPVVLADGTVIGIVFGRSDTYDNLGYAITSPLLKDAMEGKSSDSPSVDTRSCVSE